MTSEIFQRQVFAFFLVDKESLPLRKVSKVRCVIAIFSEVLVIPLKLPWSKSKCMWLEEAGNQHQIST